MALDTKTQLPKLGGIVQPDFITKAAVKKNEKDEENIEDSIGFKLALQEALNPPLDQLLGGEGKGGGNSHATMAQLISQAEQLLEIKTMSRSVKELTEVMKKGQSVQALAMHGKEVSYDDSVRTVSKDAQEINFKYDLRYGVAAPDDAKAAVNITISDEQGKIVYSTKQIGVKGLNQYKWDGRDNNGKKVEAGDYKLSVSAAFDKGANFGAIEATTSIRGMVESVKIEGGKTVLRVNGENIDFDRITEIGASTSTVKPKPNVHEMMNYINKEVEVDISQIVVSEGGAEILYNNNVENPGALRVDIFGSNSEYIKTITHTGKLAQGVGSFMLNAKKEGIADGEYNTKVTVQNKDNDNSYITLDNTKLKVVVESIDVANSKLKAGGQNYDARSIVNVVGESNLVTLGSQFMGKRVQYVDDKFKFSGADYRFPVPVAQTPAGRQMGEAELRVFKGDKQVAIRNIDPVEPNPIPAYANLDATGKALVDNFIKDEFQTTRRVIQYNQLVGDQKRLTDRFIAIEFRSGRLFVNDADRNTPATVDANKAIGGTIIWDGHMEDGTQASDGEEFRYELLTSTEAAGGGDLKAEVLVQSAAGFVVKTTIKDNTLLLELRDGTIIPYTNVEAIG